MALSDELANLRATAKIPDCSTCRWYHSQPEADRAEFDACVEDESVRNSALRAACIPHGLDVSRESFNTHIREHHGKGPNQ